MKCQHLSLLSSTPTTHLPLFSISIPPHRSCQPLSAVLRPVTCRAATPPPHQTDPPPQNHSGHLQELAASLSQIQDRVQIFFAVLFWMSLFFWYSAWDGRDKPNKGSRFRR